MEMTQTPGSALLSYVGSKTLAEKVRKRRLPLGFLKARLT